MFNLDTQIQRHLICSTARGAVSLERLDAAANGALRSTVTSPWAEGTPGLTRSPLDLLEQLAAQVPLPRLPLVRDGGCLAPPSSRRRLLPPPPRQQGAASRRPRAASTSACETFPGADGVVFRVARVVFRVARVVFASTRGVRATGGHHAKCALKNLSTV